MSWLCRLVSCALALVVLFAAGEVSAQTCGSITVPAPSGTAHDITFGFDAEYACGRFANGDWWVVADAQSGAVGVTSLTPWAQAGRDGWQANPADISAQAFDDRITGYDAALEPALPFAAPPGTSLVKSVSVPDDGSTSCRPCLQFAAVVTVLDAAPPDPQRTFRPPYFGTDKALRTLDTLALERLPRLDATAPAATLPTFDGLLARFTPVQLDHKTNWTGRDMHPIDNLPDYGASIAKDNATAALRFMLDDFDPADATHHAALVAYLQMGLDLAGMVAGGMRWPANGGHSNGRKLPVAFAAHLLDDPALVELAGRDVYSENEQVFFSPHAGADGQGVALYGMPCSESEYWQHIRNGNGNRACRDPYGYIDGGSDEIGAAYQTCCTAAPWRYTALAVRLMRLEDVFAWQPLLDYSDRFAQDGVHAAPDPCAPYDGNPDNYGVTYGPDGNGSCIAGSGRYPEKHGVHPSINYDSSFGQAMWDAFRGCIPDCPGLPVEEMPGEDLQADADSDDVAEGHDTTQPGDTDVSAPADTSDESDTGPTPDASDASESDASETEPPALVCPDGQRASDGRCAGDGNECSCRALRTGSGDAPRWPLGVLALVACLFLAGGSRRRG